MKPAEFLYTHSLFRREEFARAMRLRGPRAPATLTKQLQNWCREGRLHAVRRGVYLRLGSGQGPAQVIVDPFALASRLAPDAVLAYHTALEAHGRAQSVFERLYFATWTKAGPIRFQGHHYVPVRPRAALARFGEANGARPPRDAFVVRLDRAGLEVSVASLERTLVDVLDRPDLAGGMEEVFRSCGSIVALDFSAMHRYLLLVSRPLLVARVGFLLESNARRWLTPGKLLVALEAQRPRSPVYLERRQPGRLVQRWNLIVPPALPPQEDAADGDAP